MSDANKAADTKAAEGAAPPAKQEPAFDPKRFENKLAEYDRKLNNMFTKLDTIAKPPAPKKQEPEASLSDTLYEDEGRFVEAITDRVAKKVGAQTQAARDLDTAVTYVTTEYPEMLEQGSEFNTNVRQQLLEWGYQDFKDVPGKDIKAAAAIAAADLGIKPKSKRRKEEPVVDSDDEVSFDGEEESSSSKRRSKDKDKLSEGTLAWADKLGLNTKDPKQIERLKQRTKRAFGSYKSVKNDE